MSDNLTIRLNYRGGRRADGRMELDKLKSLKKALLYSYQAETLVKEDGREFRCLINPDKLKNDYDNKILSIPYKDICLNEEFTGQPTSIAEQSTDIKVGDVFCWKETNTYWLVYLQHLEESAYFRAEIRKCSDFVVINDKKYRAYIRGPVETTIRWNQKSDIIWNDLNYSKIAYVPEDEFTTKLARFDIIQVNGENFEVQAVNKDTASDGIMIIHLKETFTNSIQEQLPKEEKKENISEIQGDMEVYPYDVKTYTTDNFGGEWVVSDKKKLRIISQTEQQVIVEVITGRSGSADIIYMIRDSEYARLPLTIKSL